jgi:hypothetical protein
MAADTSSAPAANTSVVEAAAAAWAALIVEPRLARSVAAAITISGVAITNDMADSQQILAICERGGHR